MDATAERFAYRCLPLAIANSHGWELLSPVAFDACWSGGDETGAVEIRVDPGAAEQRIPVSLFGHGTITWHVEGIFRTPPGWNLFVTGPANAQKDAIQALSAMIETDWSPYSFTMNWRFTRAGQWVRFEENEPIALFFPLERGGAERFSPRLVPMADNPELAEQFRAWSASRDAFHDLVARTNPLQPADKWQKLYYRGLDAHGCPGTRDHQSKLRVQPFAGIPDYPDAIVADLPTPRPEPVLQSAPPVEALPLAEIQAPGDRTGRHAGWILGVQQSLRALADPPGGVDEVSALSRDAFLRDHYAAGRPVLIRGALSHWPAVRRWTPSYLAERVGPAEVEYQGGRGSNPDFELYKDDHKARMPFNRFMAAIDASGCGNDAYITAYNSGSNAAALAPLADDLEFIDDYLTREHGMMWIGPMGTFTPLHFDLTNNLFAQLVGAKKLSLVSPSETSLLYNSRHVFSDVHDITDDEKLERFPLAREAKVYEVVVAAGDLLFLPIGWWHQVTALDFSVSLTYTNFLWPNDGYRTYSNG